MTQTYRDGAWAAVLKGKIYCSPACGRGCTKEEFDLALAAAKKLAAQLGDGWEPVVWENMGWFARVVRGPLRVDISFDRLMNDRCEYSVCVMEDQKFVLYLAHCPDARQGIEIVVRKAREAADRAVALARAARAAAGPPIAIKDKKE